jgi:hypothetical protein
VIAADHAVRCSEQAFQIEFFHHVSLKWYVKKTSCFITIKYRSIFDTCIYRNNNRGCCVLSQGEIFQHAPSGRERIRRRELGYLGAITWALINFDVIQSSPAVFSTFFF